LFFNELRRRKNRAIGVVSAPIVYLAQRMHRSPFQTGAQPAGETGALMGGRGEEEGTGGRDNRTHLAYKKNAPTKNAAATKPRSKRRLSRNRLASIVGTAVIAALAKSLTVRLRSCSPVSCSYPFCVSHGRGCENSREGYGCAGNAVGAGVPIKRTAVSAF
jgi:hypothetical protein